MIDYAAIPKEKIIYSTNLSGKIGVYEVSCPECSWKVASYSVDLAVFALSKHMEHDHREQLLGLIRAFDNIDQVLIDLLTDPPRKFSKQIFESCISCVAVSKDDWLSMPDIVQVI